MEHIQRILPTKSKRESRREFERLDSNGDQSACRQEIAAYIASNHEMWAMLSVNLDKSEEYCQEIATRVAMELASGKEGEDAMNAEIDIHQFHAFRKKYMLDPHGQQEFFHRSVFATFDSDNNAHLDSDELDQFLDTFYKSGSIFKGDVRLPPKEVLKNILLSKMDADNDRGLCFEKMRGIISGAAMHELEFVNKK